MDVGEALGVAVGVAVGAAGWVAVGVAVDEAVGVAVGVKVGAAVDVGSGVSEGLLGGQPAASSPTTKALIVLRNLRRETVLYRMVFTSTDSPSAGKGSGLR